MLSRHSDHPFSLRCKAVVRQKWPRSDGGVMWTETQCQYTASADGYCSRCHPDKRRCRLIIRRDKLEAMLVEVCDEIRRLEQEGTQTATTPRLREN